MMNLSELEATEAHQLDKHIIQNYPFVSFTTVSSKTLLMTKKYSYDEENDEVIKDEHAGSPVDGTFYRVDNLSLHDLYEHFGRLTEKEAIIHGTIEYHEEIGICTKKYPVDGCIARTIDNFNYPDNALMLFDYDPSDRGYKISSAEDFIETLESIDPQLRNCAYFYKSSASGGIRLNDELRNNTGFHLYLTIPGDQLKLYAKILFKRCILNDLGHAFISKDGRKYIRTIFDAAVHSPERLDYMAPAIVNKPLTIDDPISNSRPGNSIDGSLLVSLTPEEEASYQDKRKKLLSDAEDDAFDVLYKYVKDQSKTTGIAAERLMRFHAMGGQGEIDFEHPLTKDDGVQFSFADVVADPDKYKNLSIPDPFDPGDGPSKARLYINDNSTIVINSFAHGGTVYKLHQDGKLYTGKTSKTRREFKMIGPAEILAKSPVPNWLIKSYIIQKSIAQIVAKSEAGKSFATIDMGLRVATGQDWNNCKVAQGPVAYLNAEGYEGVTARIQGWQQEHQSIVDAPFLLSTEALDLTDDDAVASAQVTLDRFAQRHDNHISLIIVDTMRRSMTGDENSSHVFEKFLSNLEYLCRLYGATGLINHHPGHNSDLARGSSAQLAAMDTQLLIRMKGGKLQLECIKLKDGGKKPDPVGFELREIQLPELDDDGKHVTTCVVEYTHLSGQQSTRAKKLNRMPESLRNTLNVFNGILDSSSTTDVSKGAWRDRFVIQRTLKDPGSQKDIDAAKKMFSRSLKSLIETEVIDVNSDGNYQYGDDIEPLWSDVKTCVPSKHFK